VNVLLVPAHPGFPGQIPQSRKTVVCVCVYFLSFTTTATSIFPGESGLTSSPVGSLPHVPGIQTRKQRLRNNVQQILFNTNYPQFENKKSVTIILQIQMVTQSHRRTAWTKFFHLFDKSALKLQQQIKCLICTNKYKLITTRIQRHTVSKTDFLF